MSQQTLEQCGKCGICLAVCPVYRVLAEEQASPRAKIQLIKAYEQHSLPGSILLKELVNRCLMCGSCAAICPSGVEHTSLFMAMRQELGHEQKDRLEIRGLMYLLAREQRLQRASRLARIGQTLTPTAFQERWTIGHISADRLPVLNKKPFRDTVAEQHPVAAEKKGTVLYFTGCATNYLFAATGQATVRLLGKMGYEVVIPHQQTCCSLPMLYHGAQNEAVKNIRQNLEALRREDIAAIIVDCPTCGAALKNEYPALAERYGLDTEGAGQLAAKVMDIMSFVSVHQQELPIAVGEQSVAVTYHAPCHLKNNFSPASRVLQTLPVIDYRPAVDAMECCGGGGTFFYEYPEIAHQMALQKVANAQQTQARYWLTDCPVCRINLGGTLDKEASLELLHPVELLNRLTLAAPSSFAHEDQTTHDQ